MKLRTKLYINTNNDLTAAPQYEELDMFDFESIELTSSIQEIRDIGSVFTDFSQEFSVPASVNNNRIFTHYYNTNLLNQFDARIKRKGLITINNLTFREGYIRLSEVKLKNNRASSYKLTFFGELVNLKQVLGDDELKDLGLGLSKYNHEYSVDNVYDGFIDGLGLVAGEMVKSSNRDIVYPSISPSDRWYYKSDPTDLGEKDYRQGKTVNLFTNNVGTTYGVDYTKLKPAIKVKNVIDAIQEVYSDRGIVFSNDFFSDVEFNQIYLLLHKEKGNISSASNSTAALQRTYVVGTSDADSPFQLNSFSTDFRPLTTSYQESNPMDYQYIDYELDLFIEVLSPSSSIKYTVELLDGTEVIASIVDADNDSNLIYYLSQGFQQIGTTTWNNLSYRISTNGGLDTFNVGLTITEYVFGEDDAGNFDYQNTSNYILVGTQTMITEINIVQHMPKIKIYDFLKGLFNMFNLTAYVENGVIVVKTLDDFYSDGNEIDISNQIDTKDITIKRMNLFSNINFDFSEPKTFGLIKQNEVNQDDYGNLEYEPSTSSLIFDGDRYSIKLPFEKLFFDRLSDENTPFNLTDFGNGWLVDKDENETITPPVLFFNRNTTISSGQYFGFIGKTAQLTTYNRPSNSSNSELSTINFNAENDEFTGNLIENSLFKLHYENYIENIFNQSSRMYSISAILNLDTLNSYKMNDTLIINNTKFIINSIRTDLSNGKTELELITE
jgi:hypothetical protein